LAEVLCDRREFSEAVRPLKQAIEHQRTVIEYSPENPKYNENLRAYYRLLVNALLQTGNHADALDLAADRANVAPDDWETRLAAAHLVGNCIEFYLKDSALSDADRMARIVACNRRGIELLEDFLEKAPNHTDARRLLSETYRAVGRGIKADRPDDAIDAYRRAIELSPTDAGPHNDLAFLLATGPELSVRDPAEAVLRAEKAVELEPGNGAYWNTLGVARYRAGAWQSAIDALEKSAELRSGGDAWDWLFLAMAHWQVGEKQEARKWYDEAVSWMEENKPKDEELLRFRKEGAELLGITEEGEQPQRDKPGEDGDEQ
jgi:tetratricopeptide (TPR) repeat protein